MDEETVRPGIQLIEKTDKTVTDGDIKRFEEFINRERVRFMARFDDPSPEVADLGDAGMNHAFAHSEIIDRLRDQLPFSLVLAEDTNHQIVGFSMVDFNPKATDPAEKVEETFLGVESPYYRQGIGLQLLQARHKILQEMEIPSYVTVAREVVQDMYKKLKLPFEVLYHATGSQGFVTRVHLTPSAVPGSHSSPK